MRKVRIICVGKNQDAYLKNGISLYETKLKRYCKLNWEIVKESAYNRGSQQQWVEDESKRISKIFSSTNYTIACDEHGQTLTSIEVAECFRKAANRGFSQIDFVIGGAFGLAKGISESANLTLSLSPLTFTHQMVRLILIEQIYRTFTILNNEKYHHL